MRGLVITLTGAGTLVGTGNAAYIWAPASWDEVVDVSDVVDNGDYFLIADEQPTQLPIEIPYTDVEGGDGHWARIDGSNIPAGAGIVNRIQGDNETVRLENTYTIEDTTEAYYIQLTETNDLNTARIRLPSSASGSQDDLDLTRLVKDRAWIDIAGYIIDVTQNATRAVIGTSLTFTFNYVVVDGTKPVSGTTQPDVYGEDVHRGEIARAAFKNETPSIDGKGGTDNQVWTRVSGEGTWADRYEYTPPAWTTFTNLNTEQAPDEWTNLLTNVADSDMVEIGYVGEMGGNNNWGVNGAVFRFGFLPTSTKTWAPRPADSGARFNLRRNGTTLQGQTAGPLTGESYELYVRNLG